MTFRVYKVIRVRQQYTHTAYVALYKLGFCRLLLCNFKFHINFFIQPFAFYFEMLQSFFPRKRWPCFGFFFKKNTLYFYPSHLITAWSPTPQFCTLLFTNHFSQRPFSVFFLASIFYMFLLFNFRKIEQHFFRNFVSYLKFF